jgi:hypothetical protein
VQVADGKRTLMVASIRYLDRFIKTAGKWLFSEGKLMVDWIETRPMNQPLRAAPRSEGI